MLRIEGMIFCSTRVAVTPNALKKAPHKRSLISGFPADYPIGPVRQALKQRLFFLAILVCIKILCPDTPKEGSGDEGRVSFVHRVDLARSEFMSKDNGASRAAGCLSAFGPLSWKAALENTM